MTFEVPGHYPTFIREARYSGTYSRSRWVLTAGSYAPTKDTDAFAGDPACARFWNDLGDGPESTEGVIYVEGYSDDPREVIVVGGETPNECLERAREIAAERGESE